MAFALRGCDLSLFGGHPQGVAADIETRPSRKQIAQRCKRSGFSSELKLPFAHLTGKAAYQARYVRPKIAVRFIQVSASGIRRFVTSAACQPWVRPASPQLPSVFRRLPRAAQE